MQPKSIFWSIIGHWEPLVSYRAPLAKIHNQLHKALQVTTKCVFIRKDWVTPSKLVLNKYLYDMVTVEAFVLLPLSWKVKDDSVTNSKIVCHVPKKKTIIREYSSSLFSLSLTRIRWILTNSNLMYVVKILHGDLSIIALPG